MTDTPAPNDMPDGYSEHLRAFGYLDGYYTGICYDCAKQFIGAKRSVRCKPCAEKEKSEYDAQARADAIIKEVGGDDGYKY